MRAQQDSVELLRMQRSPTSCDYNTSHRSSGLTSVVVQFGWIHGDFDTGPGWYRQEESQATDKGI